MDQHFCTERGQLLIELVLYILDKTTVITCQNIFLFVIDGTEQ